MGLLEIKSSDMWRVTLSDQCGNVGYVGISPEGNKYHVVVPVDLQIARGVKAGNKPVDGTPFGGYKDWNYFQCQPYNGIQESVHSEKRARLYESRQNGKRLVKWAREKGWNVEIVEDVIS